MTAKPTIITGPLLRERREALFLTQVEFGVLIGVSRRTVGEWERGKRPALRHRRALAEFFAKQDEAA